MRRSWFVIGVLFGILASITVIAVSYLGGQIFGLPFFPFDLFEFVTRVLPGRFVATSISTMVGVITALHIGPLAQTAKLAEEAIALVQFILVGAIFGAGVAWLNRRMAARPWPVIALAAAAVVLVLTLLFEAYLGFTAPVGVIPSVIWLAAIIALWGLALGWLLSPREVPQAAAPDFNRSRRDLLTLGGTAIVALIASALGLGEVFRSRTSAAPEASAAAPASTSAALPDAAAQVLASSTTVQPPATPATPSTQGQPAQTSASSASFEPAPGTRAEITPNDNFYRIDIGLIPPHVDEKTWRLELTGLVKNPMSLTLDQIRARPSVSQYVTLSCISNPLGGELISTSQWTGIRLKDLLMEAGLKPGAQELAIHAFDGFYESVYHEDMLDERTLLVYAMGGQTLTDEHGFPLRIYIPNRYGMKQPKWIKSMEVIDHAGPGYWVDRGWSAQATAQTTSVIDGADVTKKTSSGAVPIGGIAWAGAHGISKVEVQIDDGAWVEARLKTPALSGLTWVQWRYDAAVTRGMHYAHVRATDGQGVLQVSADHDDFPDGATGLLSKTFWA
jgi:DMSO/TMAO reductase YedYZ molybdopterin-dependent catalytic subunit